jgi:hypothetical protein
LACTGGFLIGRVSSAHELMTTIIIIIIITTTTTENIEPYNKPDVILGVKKAMYSVGMLEFPIKYKQEKGPVIC